ncbi:MAG TPA: DegT/DnrJ/EryC1/StrS family aminotransferase [Anaerolineae bacterium]|nr:DegT/DnrJ/EryC1/StrS family aminotransferase [Anaerolineae bacterium]
MIPRHCLPFGLGEVISVLLTRASAPGSSELEQACAESLEAQAVVLVPSVRAGIHMTVQAACRPGATAVSPAYTSPDVHDALVMSGARPLLLDAGADSYLLSAAAVDANANSRSAVVLSEVFGLPYEMLHRGGTPGAGYGVRILDLAMCIPAADRVRRLKDRDVAIYGFGWGKPMYAGWGGIACFQDNGLANKVRNLRDQWLHPESRGVQLRCMRSIVLRTALNERSVYGLWHAPLFQRLHERSGLPREAEIRLPDNGAGDPAVLPRPGAAGFPDRNKYDELPDRWTTPTTSFGRALIMRNLRSAEGNARIRRNQSGLYWGYLRETGIVRGLSEESLPQSHFPIRIPAAKRKAMCDYLRGFGIDAGRFWVFPAGPGRDSFPHAARVADEAIVLPLGPGISPEEVRWISERVKDGLRKLRL